jgi:hypothetical protein
MHQRTIPRVPSPIAWDVELTSGRWTLETLSPVAHRAVAERLARAVQAQEAEEVRLSAAEVVAAAWAHPEFDLAPDAYEDLHRHGWTSGDVVSVALACLREYAAAAIIDAAAIERAASFGPRRGVGVPSSSTSAPSTAATPGPGTASPTPSGSS